MRKASIAEMPGLEGGAYRRHLLDLFGSFLGAGFDFCKNYDGPIISYGMPEEDAAISIPAVARYSPGHVPGVPSPEDYGRASIKGAEFPFDIFSATRFWLCDEGNSVLTPDVFDEHGRLKASMSVQARLGLLDTPIVNAYFDLFRHWVESRVGALCTDPILSPQKKCAVVLSHDVDYPYGPGDILKFPSRYAHAFLSARGRKLMTEAKEAILSVPRWMKRPGERFWLFKEIMREEEKRGLRSTWFFIATPRYESSALEFDAPYSVGSGQVKAVIAEMRSRGFEIGLHSSFGAKDLPGRLGGERLKLEKAAGCDIVCNRHHFLRMGNPFWETLQIHERAGFAVDSSIGFNDANGYRLGVARPFRPYNPLTGRVSNVLEVPMVCMDQVFFRDGKKSKTQRLDEFCRQLEMLKKYRAVVSINWHDRTSYPAGKIFADWGEMYLEVLDLIAGDRDVETVSFGELEKRYRSITDGERL